MLLKPNSRILFIGDSITDCGRQRPVGAGSANHALGNGYVRLVAAALASYPSTRGVRLINMGRSGDTVRDLSHRWPTDVTALQPEWLSVMIGINDVWSHFQGLWGYESQISPLEYRRTLSALVAATRPRLQGLVLMAPYYLEQDLQDPMRRLMDEFGAEMRQIAHMQEAIFVDTQAVFDVLMDTVAPEELAEDRVHVGQRGHEAIASAFLEAVEFPSGDAG
jgi:lysophospholipase L1-like esterase